MCICMSQYEYFVVYFVHLFCTWWSIAVELFSNDLLQTLDYFENRYLRSCWFHCFNIFCIKLRFCETFTVINFVTRTLFIEALPKFRTIKCWFTLYLPMYVLDLYKFKCFVYPASLSCVSHSIDICTVAIKYQKYARCLNQSNCRYFAF